MSVTTDIEIRRRPLINRSGDPSLPETVWYTQGGVAGDVSGGFAEINIILNPAGDTRSGRAWSIMLSLPTLALAAEVIGIFNSLNMDNIGPGLNNPIQKAFAQPTRGASDTLESPESAIAVENLHPNVFLGAQMASTQPATIRIQFPNANGQTFGWHCAGYEWGPLSLNAGYSLPLGGFIG